MAAKAAPRRFDDQVSVSGQISPDDVAGLPGAGIAMLINNRPDGEDPGQPAAGDIEAAAERAGIAYRHIPIIRGIGPADVQAMDLALGEAKGGKVLAFCRSGSRSALVCALARRQQGVAQTTVEQQLIDAGVDPTPIAHLL
ncbi:MAG: TIGR01244 family sulfur transferase [Pseudomonadota bacterium]|nr:TIGR01244 family sulfur transferase [Pseudomonadota bacterium]